LKFGVFDHVDRSHLPLHEYYEARLKLVEFYDQNDFHAYHIAEHHQTPLGMAASPSVFLAAVAQRSRRLRFGPMIWALPLYHPLRMIEEICMLDQMSGGRLEMGFGRGASPIELEYFGQNPADAQAIYNEALELIVKGLTEKSLTYHGKFFNFDNVPMALDTFQKPYPPIWYGVHAPESAARAAKRGLHAIELDNPRDTKVAYDSFRAAWKEAHGARPLPLMGLGRFIVVAPTDAEGVAIARRAYPAWEASFSHLRNLLGRTGTHPRPPTYDELEKVGQGIAGSPATVTKFLREQLLYTGSNYLVGQFAFGDLRMDETLRSLDLFVREVMPALRDIA
jgi:alkanesulfonate monooxygenase SsuD/methylene tetrahydromethanopterin reductase-like flavin-dependent oxidoreductase (luciferase family)